MIKKKKVLFNYKSSYLDSVYVFDNGDFILFGVTDKSTNDTSERKSALYDGRTFKPKLSLKMTSVCAFSYLANDKFSICVDNSYFNSYFQLCKFNSDRTSYEEIQKLSSIEGGSAKNVKEMSNGDLCINRVYVGFNNIYIFRKNESNPKYEPYGNTFLYHLEDLNELMNLNEKEALGYKINHGEESLTFNIVYWLNYNYRGLGIMSVIVPTICKYFFTRIKEIKEYCICWDKKNSKSAGLAKKTCNFIRTGHEKEYKIKKKDYKEVGEEGICITKK